MNLLTAFGLGVNTGPQADSPSASREAPRKDIRFADDYRRETSRSDDAPPRQRPEETVQVERAQRLAPRFDAIAGGASIVAPEDANETDDATRAIVLPTEGLSLLDGRLFQGRDAPRRILSPEAEIAAAIAPVIQIVAPPASGEAAIEESASSLVEASDEALDAATRRLAENADILSEARRILLGAAPDGAARNPLTISRVVEALNEAVDAPAPSLARPVETPAPTATPIRIDAPVPTATPQGAVVAAQVVAAIRSDRGNSSIDVRLDPPELGKVRIQFAIDRADIVTAVISAERGETLDLLRRHAGDLGRELIKAGFEDVRFEFGASDKETASSPTPYKGSEGADATADAEADASAMVYLRAGGDARLDRLV